jgi:hypothetical protein
MHGFSKIGLWTVVFLLGLNVSARGGSVPHAVGGFELDRSIDAYKERVILETALPIRYMENIQEVEIKPIEGFKSGLIAYGTCYRPGHIVRIKLKYADESKTFFEQLLKRFEDKFGKPDEYRGDPFHILISWKWSFVDSRNNRISLTLQHNTLDEEEKVGNAVKLTMSNLLEEDRNCFRKQMTDQRELLRQRKWDPIDLDLAGWERFVPR